MKNLTGTCSIKYKNKKERKIVVDKTIFTEEGELVLEIPDSVNSSPDVLAEKEEINRNIRLALLSLPDIQRAAFILTCILHLNVDICLEKCSFLVYNIGILLLSGIEEY